MKSVQIVDDLGRISLGSNIFNKCTCSDYSELLLHEPFQVQMFQFITSDKAKAMRGGGKPGCRCYER